MNALPPTVRGLPLVGAAPWLALDPVKFLERRIGEQPYVRLRLGPYDSLVVNTAEGVQEVLVDKQQCFTAITPVRARMRGLFGNGLLTNDGASWLRQRRLIQPAFHKKHLAEWAQIMASESEATFEAWRRQGPHVSDMADEMMALSLRIVSKALFGVDCTPVLPRIERVMDDVLKGIWRARRFPLPIPLSVPTPGNRLFLRSRRELNALIYELLAERRKHQGGQDLMTLLLEAQDADTGERMSDRQVRDEIITFLLAGHETTATGLTWLWILLAEHPAAAAKLRRELDEKLAGRAPGFSDLAELRYLGQVVNECLRLYPPAWSMARIALADTSIDGQTVKKGTLVLMFPFGIHRSARYWENPLAFDPERFAPEKTAERPRFSFFPFGGGLRLCPGNLFGFYQLQIVIATLLPRVHVTRVGAGKIPVIPSVTMRPRDGMPMFIEAAPQIKYN